jgi:hypothetical protein
MGLRRRHAMRLSLAVALHLAASLGADAVPQAKSKENDGCCHMWTLPAGKGFVERVCKMVGCGHMYGLLVRFI